MLKRIWIHIYHETFCVRKMGYNYFDLSKTKDNYNKRQCLSCGKIQKRIKGTLWDTWK